MDTAVDLVTKLRRTSKGQLKYDRDWYQPDKIEDVLAEFSSPPHIPYCPSAAKCKRTSFIEDPEVSYEEPGNSNSLEDVIDLSVPKKNDTNFSSVNPKKNTEEEAAVRSEMFRSQKAIVDYENAYDNRVKSLVQERSDRFRQHSEKLAVEAQNKVYQFYNKQEHDAVNKLQQTEALYRQKLDEIHEKHKKLREHHKRHAQMLDTKMRRAEEQKRQLEKEEERLRQEELKEFLDNLAKLLTGVKDFHVRVEDTVKGCKYPDLLGETGGKCITFSTQIVMKAEQVYKQAGIHNSANPQYEQIMLDLSNSAKSTADYVKTIVENTNKKGEEAEKAKAAAVKASDTTPTSQPAATQQATTAGATDKTTKTEASSGPVSNKILTGETGTSCVTADGLKLYSRLQDMLTEQQKSYASLLEDQQFKKYRFDLQKAVNIPVNAISPTSGSHLRDKLTRLGSLLSGHAVEIDGKRVSAAQHPGGLAFCKDLFAKKIVSQGVEQVSSNYQSAFAFAAVAIGVWSELPDVGELILAHFYKQCPYLVPFYKPLPKTLTEGDQSLIGSSPEDVLLNFDEYAQKVDSSKMDSTKDKFLKRMTGLTRLYASLMVASLPRGAQKPHPHGVEHGWIWLTSIMNLDPHPDITATIVYDFLQVMGHALWKTYGKQFLKLLQLFCTDYVAKIRAVSQQAGGGPVVRLENYIQKCISSGNIAPPEGLLPPHFW